MPPCVALNSLSRGDIRWTGDDPPRWPPGFTPTLS
jgi:hypothetical protein